MQNNMLSGVGMEQGGQGFCGRMDTTAADMMEQQPAERCSPAPSALRGHRQMEGSQTWRTYSMARVCALTCTPRSGLSADLGPLSPWSKARSRLQTPAQHQDQDRSAYCTSAAAPPQ
uniref:Uncharacterized protein n=1 Tax=Knipowitschia caucasica TaxID=637954 RepID=A0AAV2L0B1_KNICA